jgi:hypothetical protein
LIKCNSLGTIANAPARHAMTRASLRASLQSTSEVAAPAAKKEEGTATAAEASEINMPCAEQRSRTMLDDACITLMMDMGLYGAGRVGQNYESIVKNNMYVRAQHISRVEVYVPVRSS